MNQGYPQQPYPQPPPQKSNTVLVVILVIAGLLVVFGGMLAVMALYGTRKYIANAKTVEARNTLTFMAKDAEQAYEENKKLCPSASAPVPADRSQVSGKKYLASSSEWSADQAKNAGFACLKFEMSSPQYYQYDYRATDHDFTATARGDLNGDGVFSEFSITGVVKDGRLVLSPTIAEKNPEE